MKPHDILKTFCHGANFYMVKYDYTNDHEFGKIIQNDELNTINLAEHEIYRSIEYTNGNTLFVLDLKPETKQLVPNPIQLLIMTMEDAKAIELVYPNIFTWIFNGLYIKGYAIVPSGHVKANSTISRYGGTINFIKILQLHLKNISKLKRGETPDYNFLNINGDITDTELAVGSINKFTDSYSIVVDTSLDYVEIIKRGKAETHLPIDLKILNMKYWAREINPDFISEAKHIKLKDTIPLMDNIYRLYPAPMKRLMELPKKGHYYRFVIARFLLSIHSPKDAKFMYYSILGDDERAHVKSGNCSTQWNFIQNNFKRYDCPTMKELSAFVRDGDEPLSHPLEKLQKQFEKNDDENRDGREN